MRIYFTQPIQRGQAWNVFYRPGLALDCGTLLCETLRAQGAEVLLPGEEGEEAPDVVVHDRFPETALFARWPQAKHFYWALEPEVVLHYDCAAHLRRLAACYDAVFTFDDTVANPVDGIYKMYIPFNFDCSFVPAVPFGKKRLVCSISGDKDIWCAGELYTQRRKAIDWFTAHRPEQFRFYGQGWRPSYRRLPTYGGATDCKLTVYDGFKFALCFENSKNQPGYVTEKMLDCLLAGVVPVYDGPDNVADYVPADCFVRYRDYGSPQALCTALESMPESEWQAKRAAGAAFCRSAQAAAFAPQRLAETMLRAAAQPKRVQQGAAQTAAVEHILREHKWYMRLHAAPPRWLKQLDR